MFPESRCSEWLHSVIELRVFPSICSEQRTTVQMAYQQPPGYTPAPGYPPPQQGYYPPPQQGYYPAPAQQASSNVVVVQAGQPQQHVCIWEGIFLIHTIVLLVDCLMVQTMAV